LLDAKKNRLPNQVDTPACACYTKYTVTIGGNYMQNQLPKFFLNAPHTSTSLDAARGHWIVIQPLHNWLWVILPDQWRCVRFNCQREDRINAIQEE
tara:strand:+ start:612 stop:899 length:288 start_codon:yes stop_codon:yes gene_type:complete